MSRPGAHHPAPGPGSAVPVVVVRLAVLALGLGAVALAEADGGIGDLLVIVGAVAAVVAAARPRLPLAATIVVVAALVARTTDPDAEIDAGVAAQAAALLLFHLGASLLAVIDVARTVELRALRPTLLRAAAALAALAPAWLLVAARPGESPLASPGTTLVLALAAATTLVAVPLLVVGAVHRRDARMTRWTSPADRPAAPEG